MTCTNHHMWSAHSWSQSSSSVSGSDLSFSGHFLKCTEDIQSSSLRPGHSMHSCLGAPFPRLCPVSLSCVCLLVLEDLAPWLLLQRSLQTSIHSRNVHSGALLLF